MRRRHRRRRFDFPFAHTLTTNSIQFNSKVGREAWPKGQSLPHHPVLPLGKTMHPLCSSKNASVSLELPVSLLSGAYLFHAYVTPRTCTSADRRADQHAALPSAGAPSTLDDGVRDIQAAFAPVARPRRAPVVEGHSPVHSPGCSFGWKFGSPTPVGVKAGQSAFR